MQLHAQLPQTGRGFFVVVGRNAFLVEKLLRALHFIFELVVLDLQRLDTQQVVGVVQFGQQSPLSDVIAFLHMDTLDLSGRFESEADCMRLTDNPRMG